MVSPSPSRASRDGGEEMYKRGFYLANHRAHHRGQAPVGSYSLRTHAPSRSRGQEYPREGSRNINKVEEGISMAEMKKRSPLSITFGLICCVIAMAGFNVGITRPEGSTGDLLDDLPFMA